MIIHNLAVITGCDRHGCVNHKLTKTTTDFVPVIRKVGLTYAGFPMAVPSRESQDSHNAIPKGPGTPKVNIVKGPKTITVFKCFLHWLMAQLVE